MTVVAKGVYVPILTANFRGYFLKFNIQCVSRNTPDVFSRNLNKYFPILIIFGIRIT